MHRYTITRKICDTVLGATYECERSNATPRHPGRVASNHRRSTPIVIKCCATIKPVPDHELTTQATVSSSSSPVKLDDPMCEYRVVERLIASGGHNNVLQCYDTFVTNDNLVCIVSELCDGGDLFQHLSSAPDHAVPQAEAVALVLQVARGLRFLQSVGFAHRDVSLENVLLRGGTCKLADFGAAIAMGTRCTDRVGKSQYMAPEVVCASADSWYDPSLADVWSLGVMLFILVTGSPLVCVASEEDARYRMLLRHGVGAIFASWGVPVSSELTMLLSCMLEADPLKRVGIAEVETSLVNLRSWTVYQ